MTGATNVEPGPFGPFSYLVVDVIDGDGESALVAASHHTTVVIAWRYRDYPRISAHSMGDSGSTVGACRNFANGEVGVGHRIAVVEVEHELGAGGNFAVDTDIEWGWCRAIPLYTRAVAARPHVNDRFEINVDVVQHIPS